LDLTILVEVTASSLSELEHGSTVSACNVEMWILEQLARTFRVSVHFSSTKYFPTELLAVVVL